MKKKNKKKLTDKNLLALLEYTEMRRLGQDAKMPQISWENLNIRGMDVGNVYKETRIGNSLDDVCLTWRHMRARFISAGTGAGKSTFMKNMIFEIMELKPESKFLIFVNRTALKKNFIIDLAKRLRLREFVEQYTGKNAKPLPDRMDLGNITIVTYQEFIKTVEEGGYQNNPENGYSYVFYDEVHYFVSDSSFNEFTGYALPILVNTFHNAVRVYMTATEVEVIPYLAEVEREMLPRNLETFNRQAFLDEISDIELYEWLRKRCENLQYLYNRHTCKEFAVNNTLSDGSSYFYNYLVECEPDKLELWPETYYNSEHKVMCIDLQDSNNDTGELQSEDLVSNYCTWKKNPLEYLRYSRDYSKYEVLIGAVDVLCENKEDGATAKTANAVKKILNAIPDDSKVIIHAETKKVCDAIVEAMKDSNRNVVALSRDQTGDDKEKADPIAVKELQKIITEEKFDADVICATKLLDNGVNINDKTVKYIILLMTDIIDIIQCMGRVRPYGYDEDEKIRVIYLIQPESLIRLRINQALKTENLSLYLKEKGTLGKKLMVTLPENTFISMDVQQIPEEEYHHIEAAKVLGPSYADFKTAVKMENVKVACTLNFNFLEEEKKLNQLFMFGRLTGLNLTEPIFKIDPELKFCDDYLERYYEFIADIIPAPVIRPVEEFLEEQGDRLRRAKEAEEARQREQEEKFFEFLKEQIEVILNCKITEINVPMEAKIMNRTFEDCRKKIYDFGKDNPELLKKYPEIKNLDVKNTKCTGQGEVSKLLNETVMPTDKELRIGNNSGSVRRVLVEAR